MVYMAKNTKENRVVKPKDVVSQPRKKWAGLIADEKELKRWKNTWEEIEANITKISKCILT